MASPEVNAETITNIRIDVAALQERVEGMEEKITSGDNSVRQGIETLKTVLTQIQEKLAVVNNLTISEEGQRQINEQLRWLRKNVEGIKKDFNAHQKQHERQAGEDSAYEKLRKNWVHPVATALLIMFVLVALNAVGVDLR